MSKDPKIPLIGIDSNPGLLSKVKHFLKGYPKDYAYGYQATDLKCNGINDCSKYSNIVLRNQGFDVIGDAWTRVPYSGATVIATGYNNKLPKIYEKNSYENYMNQTADSLAKTLDPSTLKDYDIVGLYVKGSPASEKAYNEGKKHGRINTHTGHVRLDEKGIPYVSHNVHGQVYLHKLEDLLKDGPFRIVEVARPKRK